MYCISSTLLAQVTDDFEDGNFTQNPEWVGDQNLFEINSSYQLQLNDAMENHTYLSTSNILIDNTEWRFWIKLAFSPSINNFARYYLVSDNSNLNESLHGYFLQFGESGSDDAIELFKQNGTELTSICRGTEGIISSSFNIKVKVTRNESGIWKLYVDQSGGENFIFESEGVDISFSQTSSVGFYCKYTSSNSSKMYFDDVYVGPIIIDNDPPILNTVVVESDSTLSLQFNEILNEGSVSEITNYYVDGGIGNPLQALLNEIDANIVNLVFTDKFVLETNYQLSVSGVSDLAENVMEPTSFEFSYFIPSPNDVVINEIMADPTPPVALPEFEYLELYNNTQSSIDLSGWTLIIGSSEKQFSSVIITPKSFLIVAKEIAYDDFINYGEFYGFSSFSLTNSGQTLELLDEKGTIISKVSYTDNWYQNYDKEEGGWSLEQKNDKNQCSGAENWAASVNTAGGTPGSYNSIANDIVLLPGIKSIEVITDNVLQLSFNQIMNEESISNNEAYLVSNDIGFPLYVYTYYDKLNVVELYFEKSFDQGLIYNITISSSVMNCIQLNMTTDTTITFGLPEQANEFDIVINEILFNPWTNGEDYVEIYNRSEKIIDLKNLQIGSIKNTPPNPPDTNLYSITHKQILLLPDSYCLLTNSPEAVKNQYYTTNSNAFLEVYPFPSFNNDKGHVFITNLENVLIDSFSYSESLQYPLLRYDDGVALERINPDVNSSNNLNWHSAAESVGFGTPGYKNSQFVSNIDTDNSIIIDPEIFSPDNDAVDDFVNIKYAFDTPGYSMTVTIFNAGGYPVKKLVNNEYLGTEGSISWDGIQDNNSKAPVGIYVFYISLYNLNGDVKKYKKTCVLATKL